MMTHIKPRYMHKETQTPSQIHTHMHALTLTHTHTHCRDRRRRRCCQPATITMDTWGPTTRNHNHGIHASGDGYRGHGHGCRPNHPASPVPPRLQVGTYFMNASEDGHASICNPEDIGQTRCQFADQLRSFGHQFACFRHALLMA